MDNIGNYPSNSNKSKEATAEPKKDIKQVAKGTVKKKSVFGKIFSAFIAEDVPTLKEHLINNVIIPTIKDAIDDMVHYTLYNGAPRRTSGNNGRTSYDRYYNRNAKVENNSPSVSTPSNYNDICFDDRMEAEQALGMMCDTIARYGNCSVADFYDIVGITGDPYTDNNYGWTDLRDATVVRNFRGQYQIKLPRAYSFR